MCLEYFWVVKICEMPKMRYFPWRFRQRMPGQIPVPEFMMLSSQPLERPKSHADPTVFTVLVRGIWPSAASAGKSWNVQTLTLRTLGKKMVRAKRMWDTWHLRMWCFYVFLKWQGRWEREGKGDHRTECKHIGKTLDSAHRCLTEQNPGHIGFLQKEVFFMV